MKRLVLSLLLLAVSGLPALGCIALPRDPQGQADDIGLPEQRAFLYREGRNEHLVLSVQYDGAPGEFVWVIPTEGRPKVEVQGGAPFHELWKLTKIVQPAVRSSMEGAGAAPGAAPPVVVIERKTAGPYDIAVLQATSGLGLFGWLRQNGFALDPQARDLLDDYVKKGWYFVAARIRPGGGQGQITENLRNGTIAPLHLTYPAKELAYPLRVTAGNGGTSKIELFVVADNPKPAPGLRADTFTLTPQGAKGFAVSGPPGAVTTGGDFPTLRKLLPKGGTLTKYSGTLTRVQRQRDLVFARMPQ